MAGEYRLLLGPDVLDTSGNAMDLNLNGVPGEIRENRYEGTFLLPAPRVTAHETKGSSSGEIDTVIYHFDTAIHPGTFSLGADVVGPLNNAAYSWSDPQTLVLHFDPLAVAGHYEILLGPQINDLWGNAMDQDGDLTPGETMEDRYAVQIDIQAPRVTHSYPAETTTTPLEYVRISFGKSMDEDSFSLADIENFTGPGGIAIPVTGWDWKGSRTLELSFAPQTATGLYQLELGAQILDLDGNPLNQDGDENPGESMDDRYTASLIVAQSGYLEEDTTWNSDGGVIVVDNYLSLKTGVTLTIEPGTIVKFADDGRISNHGTLVVHGTPESPVIFTAIQDDTAGGDTNGDGDATSPTEGSWRGLRFYDGADGVLENIEVHYADKAIHGMGASTIELHNAQLQHGNYGVYVYTPYVDITAENCLITDNRLTGVFLRADSRAVLRNCTIVNNGMDGTGWYGAGIHLGGADLTLENTIVAFNNTEIHHAGDPPQVTLQNSLFYNPETGRILLWNDRHSEPPQLETNGSMIADPGFLQPAVGNYELGVDSPAVDAGRGTNAPTTDLLGHARYDDPNVANTGLGSPNYVDVGAFERQFGIRAADLTVVDVRSPSPIDVAPRASSRPTSAFSTSLVQALVQASGVVVSVCS